MSALPPKADIRERIEHGPIWEARDVGLTGSWNNGLVVAGPVSLRSGNDRQNREITLARASSGSVIGHKLILRLN